MTAVHPWDHPAATEDAASSAAAVAAMQDRLRRLPGPLDEQDPGIGQAPRGEAPQPAEPGAMLFVGAAGASPTITYL